MYADLNDTELAAKIAELRGHIETVEIGGNVVKVSGQGSAVEYGRANIAGLRTLYREAVAEQNRRNCTAGQAIRIRI